MKIDHRRKYGIMLDTETANGLECPLFYDLGWQVIDTKGNVYVSRSFVNRDIYIGERELMKSAYYAEKIPNYARDIREGSRVLADIWTIYRTFREDCEKYGCEFVVAHNARFDYKAVNGTMRYITKSQYRYFIPYNLEWWDTLRMAREVVANKPTYIAFCNENGYTQSNGKPRLTAEILYRYITGDKDFIESHTGLEDVEIERQIFSYCMRQHQKMEKRLFLPKEGEERPTAQMVIYYR